MKLFGTDGVRGVANSELTPEMALKLGRCAAHQFKTKSNEKPVIVIGKDTRISGDMLENALMAGITSAGVDVITAGIVPTPAMPKIIKKVGAIAGIMISASHNPYEFNGIKFFNSEGLKLTEAVEKEIEEKYLNGFESSQINYSKIGTYKIDNSLKNVYIEYAINNIKTDLKHLKIAVDTANGANYEIAKTVFDKLGVNAVYLANKPNGININVDCGSTHIENLKNTVTKHKLDLGIAFDGDADRVLIIDENGELIDGDRIILALAIDMKEKGILKNNTVVGTIMTNMGLDVALNDKGLIDADKIRHYIVNHQVITKRNLNRFESGFYQQIIHKRRIKDNIPVITNVDIGMALY